MALLAEEMKRTADAFFTMAVGRVQSSGAWSDGTARSAEDWVANATGASWGEAKGRVELATELRRYLDSLTGAPIQRRVLLNLANSLEAGGDA